LIAKATTARLRLAFVVRAGGASVGRIGGRRFGRWLPVAIADLANDPQHGVIRLVFQGANKLSE
jgi:hypothetical protein